MQTSSRKCKHETVSSASIIIITVIAGSTITIIMQPLKSTL